MKVAISSGHGLHIRGARGNPCPPQVDEVDEARKIVDRVAELMKKAGVGVETFHDNTSTSQNQNLNTIVAWHNGRTRDWDVSCHLNAFDHSAHGTEVLYVSDTGHTLATKVCNAIVAAGHFTNRGAKYNGNLAFLNGTNKPAILLEVFFCDSTSDCNLYREHFEAICEAIAESIGGVQVPDEAPPPSERPPLERPPPVYTGDNHVDITSKVTGDVTVIVNGVRTSGHEGCEHVIEFGVTKHGDVAIIINGEQFNVG